MRTAYNDISDTENARNTKKGKRMKEDFEKEEQLKPFRETNVEQNTRYFNIRI